MANRTAKDVNWVHGVNPQYLIEKIIRSRIYDSLYWKEDCFALTAENVADKAMDLKYIGGTYGGNTKPAQFLCLLLKMLQIQPDKDIVIEFIKNDDFRYVRALGAMYLRLTGTALDVYRYLEPLYNDYRKVAKLTSAGTFEVIHMDEFIDQLLHAERLLDIILPRLTQRWVLETTNELEPRVSVLEEDLDQLAEELKRAAQNEAENDKKSSSSLSDSSENRGRSTPEPDSRKEGRNSKHSADKRQRRRSRAPSSDDKRRGSRRRGSRQSPDADLRERSISPARTNDRGRRGEHERSPRAGRPHNESRLKANKDTYSERRR